MLLILIVFNKYDRIIVIIFIVGYIIITDIKQFTLI